MITANLYYLIEKLATKRFSLSDEKQTQSDIEGLLKQLNIPYEREYHLDNKDIPDFFVFGDTAVEVKIKGGARAIYAQCERYCKHDQVKNLILLSGKAMGFPGTINDKPVYVVNIAKAWM